MATIITTGRARGLVQKHFKDKKPDKQDNCSVWFPKWLFDDLFSDAATKYPNSQYGIRIYFAKYSDKPGKKGKSTIVLVNTFSNAGKNIDILTDPGAEPQTNVEEVSRRIIDIVNEKRGLSDDEKEKAIYEILKEANEGQGKPPSTTDAEMLLLQKVDIS